MIELGCIKKPRLKLKRAWSSSLQIPVMDVTATLLLVGGSAWSFKLINTVVGLLPAPEPAREKSWKWRNIGTSLLHSSLTGAWTVLCFYLEPHLLENLITSCSLLSQCLVAVSTGYFIYDSVDLALNLPLWRCWDLLLHHSVVMLCFGLALLHRLYLGFAVVSLLVEVNSIFLHVRQLLLLSARANSNPRLTMTFQLTVWLNLATFLVFRLSTLGWMSSWLVSHSDRLTVATTLTGAVGLTVVSTGSLALLYRLFRADFLHHKPRPRDEQ
ncbi:TLC domain-containing protein 2-like [Neosynchiropus ocellatus]